MGALILALLLLLGRSPDLALMQQAQARSTEQLITGMRHDLGYYSGAGCGIGEVLATSGPGTTAEGVTAAWARSLSHAWVLAQDYDRIGVGVARAADGTTVWSVVLVKDCAS